MLTPTLVEPPASALISTAEAKAHLRLDTADDDDVVTALVVAATTYLDGWSGILGRCLVTQTWSISLPTIERRMRLPLAPVQSIESVTYFDADGAGQTMADSTYRLHASAAGGPYLELVDGVSVPSVAARDDAVTLEFVAGYGDPEEVPAAIRQAALMLVAHWFEHREAVVTGTIATELPLAVRALLAPFRRLTV